jgi:hypothetical protein
MTHLWLTVLSLGLWVGQKDEEVAMRGFCVSALVLLAAALPATVQAQFFSDGFDSYVTGSTIAGQGGWETWDNNPGADTIVTGAQFFSSPNSLFDAGPADIVHQFAGVSSGFWYAKARVYVPSTQTGEMWFIMLNTYAPLGVDNWSVQVVMCVTACTTTGALPGMVVNFGGSDVPGVGSAPLITDQWVDLRVEVDLGANQYSVFYNGVLLDTQQWTITGNLQIQAFDLFSNASTESYMDDIWLDTTLPVELTGFTVS